MVNLLRCWLDELQIWYWSRRNFSFEEVVQENFECLFSGVRWDVDRMSFIVKFLAFRRSSGSRELIWFSYSILSDATLYPVFISCWVEFLGAWGSWGSCDRCWVCPHSYSTSVPRANCLKFRVSPSVTSIKSQQSLLRVPSEPDQLQCQSPYCKMHYNVVWIDCNIVVIVSIFNNGLQ